MSPNLFLEVHFSDTHLKLGNDTVSTFNQKFSANSLYMNGSAEVQLRDNTKGAKVSEVVFSGTTEDSLFQSYADVDVGTAIIQENSVAHFNTSLLAKSKMCIACFNGPVSNKYRAAKRLPQK